MDFIVYVFLVNIII